MKTLIVIITLTLGVFNTKAQMNKRAVADTKVETAPLKDFDTKVQVDALYGKTIPGQEKELIFRQSVLDETNNGNLAEKQDIMPAEEKLKLLNNNKTTATKTTNKQPN